MWIEAALDQEAEEIEEDVREIFGDILKQLASAWFQKVDWLDYLLDFHAVEAERLKKYVSPESGEDYSTLRACLHSQLTTLIERLDMMINAEAYVNLDDLM